MTGTGRVCGVSASSAPSVTTVVTPSCSMCSSSSAQNRRQRMFGSMPCMSTTSRLAPGRAAHRQPGGRPLDPPGDPVHHADGRPGHLEVVVVVRVDLGQRVASQVSSRCSMAALAASPASFQPSKAATSTGSTRSRVLRGCRLARRLLDPDRSPGKPTTRARWRGTVGLPACLRKPNSRCSTPWPDRVLVADGAMGTMLQARRPHPGRLRRSRGLQRDPQRHPPGRGARRPPRLPRGRRGRRRDQHVRREPGQPGRVRHRRPDLRAGRGRGPAGPRGRRRVHRRRTARRFVLGSVGPGTKLPTLGHAPFAALRDAYPEQVRGLLAGGVDAVLVETCQDLLQAKAAILGAQAGDGRRGHGGCRSSPRSPSRPPAPCCWAPRSAPR